MARVDPRRDRQCLGHERLTSLRPHHVTHRVELERLTDAPRPELRTADHRGGRSGDDLEGIGGGAPTHHARAHAGAAEVPGAFCKLNVLLIASEEFTSKDATGTSSFRMLMTPLTSSEGSSSSAKGGSSWFNTLIVGPTTSPLVSSVSPALAPNGS